MKRGKKLISLLVVLAVVLGATYLATLLTPEDTAEEATEPAAAVFTLDPETVTALSWYYSEEIGFEKDGDGWVYTEDPAFPLDETYISNMLDTLSEITASKTIEAVEDWDQYTLEVPICQITLTADGTAYTLKLGEETSLGGERYLSIGDGNAYLVDTNILNPFSYGLYDLLELETIPDMSNITGLTLDSAAQNYRITYEENNGATYSDEYHWFMDGKVLDTELTDALLSTVTALSWRDCADFNAQDLSAYGLDSPTATVTVQYVDAGEDSSAAASFILEIGDETGDLRYARIAGSNMVYKIYGSTVETLLYTSYYELLPDDVLLMDWEEVTALDVILDDETYQITKDTKTVTDEEGNESQETIWLLGGAEVDADSITNALDGMSSTGYATGMTPERSEEIRIVIHRDRETFPEVELVFYQYDSTQCLTTLNGEATVFAQRDAVVTLVEAATKIVLG